MTLSSIKYHVLILVFPAIAAAQAGRAELLGTVNDPGGHAVPGASASLRETSTGAQYQVLTSASGAWDFAGLLPGVYDLEIRKPGFQSVRRGAIPLRVADRVVLDLSLSLGDLSQTIEVRDSAPLLETNSGAVSMVV